MSAGKLGADVWLVIQVFGVVHNGLDAGSLDLAGLLVGDVFINVDDDVLRNRVNDALESIAARNAARQGLDDPGDLFDFTG